jgi:hypothetical protein
MREFFSAAVRSHARLIGPSLIALALVSCGGGGGGGGSTSCPGGFLTCSGTGTDSTTQDPKLLLTLVDETTGAPSNALTSGRALVVRALLTSSTGVPLAYQVVTFTTNSSLGLFFPVSGTSLTNENGVAAITLLAADLSASGAAEVTATAQVDDKNVTKKVGYSVSPVQLSLSGLSPNASALECLREYFGLCPCFDQWCTCSKRHSL